MSIKLCNKNLSEANIVFTQDSRFFICASGNEIKVYSVNTGLLVRSLECQGKVSHLIMNPINHLQLYSVSHDGAISLWDFNDGVLLKAWNPSLGQPSIAAIIDARILESSPNQIYMIFELPSKFVVCCYDFGKLENSEIIQFKNKDKFVGFGIYNDTHVIYCAERFISITCIATKTSFRIEPKSKISCFLLHPIDQTVVIGDFTGNITIWYSILNNPVMTSMHWHANAVRSLSFASGGSYLLSGGKEGVLVVWQLSSKHKDFLPRLGSDITRISTSFDETFFALVHKDNTIRIISSINLSIKQTIMGLKYANVDEKQYPPLIGIQTVPRKNQIVLNGVPGTLQFFNPFADRHILELEVAPRNRISKDDQIIDANVSHVAFSSDGLWMGTIDERDDGQFQREVYLKFWSYDINSASFCVNSRIELHHDEKITSLDVSVCDSRSPLAVTCSLDSKFKIWELKTVKDTQFWICRSTGSYKNTPAKHAVFSSDGSVLAVAYDHVVVLFDPLNCTINTVLAYSPKDVEIRQLCFSSVDHYLYVRGSTWIYVWDLLTCKVKSKSISADPKSSNFLVSSDKKFEIYSVNSKDAVFSHLGAKSIAACLYSKNNSSQILFMNVRKEIEIIDPAGKFEKQNQKNVNVAAKSAMFSDIYGKMIQTSKKTVTSSHTSKLFPFMDISSNVLPSPSVLLLPFLDRMLEKNDKVEEELVEVVVENKENVTIEKVQKKDLKPVANLRLLMKNIYQ